MIYLMPWRYYVSILVAFWGCWHQWYNGKYLEWKKLFWCFSEIILSCNEWRIDWDCVFIKASSIGENKRTINLLNHFSNFSRQIFEFLWYNVVSVVSYPSVIVVVEIFWPFLRKLCFFWVWWKCKILKVTEMSLFVLWKMLLLQVRKILQRSKIKNAHLKNFKSCSKDTSIPEGKAWYIKLLW